MVSSRVRLFLLWIVAIFCLEESSSSSVSRRAIINGEDAPAQRYPYMVSIQRKNDLTHFCGGVLIAPDVVLTSIRCTRGDLVVRIHAHNLETPLAASETKEIKSISTHPHEFDPTPFANDVALLQLSSASLLSPVVVNDNNTLLLDNETLVTMGYGTVRFGFDVFPSVLQRVEVYALTNQQCLALNENGLLGSYETLLDDSNLCALDSIRGPCSRDQGGPLIRPGSQHTHDVLVGIILPRSLCASVEYPTIYSRVSWNYEFIRNGTCVLSEAPPDYMDCNDASPHPTGSIAPSISPSIAPSIAPGMSAVTTTGRVTVAIQLDAFPTETGWAIADAADNTNIVLEVPPGTYGPSMAHRLVTQTVSSLQEGSMYDFYLIDSVGNGLQEGSYAIVYYGDNPEQVLVSIERFVNAQVTVESFFLMPPSMVPTSSMAPTRATVMVTLVLQFDLYPYETGWYIVASDGSIVADVDPGTYQTFQAKQRVHEEIALFPDESYTLFVTDFNSNGFCCDYGDGFASLYLGDNVMDQDHFLAFLSGAFVGPFASVDFMTTMKSDWVTVLVEIRLDSAPQEVGWYVAEQDHGDVVRVSPGTYTEPNAVVTQRVKIHKDQTYLFGLLDTAGNGLCCAFGQGSATIYLDDDVLLHNQGAYNFHSVEIFRATHKKSKSKKDSNDGKSKKDNGKSKIDSNDGKSRKDDSKKNGKSKNGKGMRNRHRRLKGTR